MVIGVELCLDIEGERKEPFIVLQFRTDNE